MPSTITDRLQGLTTSVAVKPPCVAVSLNNITLSGLQTVNSVALAEGDRVLVAGQTDQTANGIYNASTSNWQRAKDFDGNRDVINGTLVVAPVDEVFFMYRTVATDPVVIGATAINFETVAVNDDASVAIEYDATDAVPLNLHDYIEDTGEFLLMGFVPQNLKSAIRARTSTADISAYFQNCIDALVDERTYGAVRLPMGRMRLATAVAQREGVSICGSGVNGSHLQFDNCSGFTFDYTTGFQLPVYRDFSMEGINGTTRVGLYQAGTLDKDDQLYGLAFERVAAYGWHKVVSVRNTQNLWFDKFWAQDCDFGFDLGGRNLVTRITASQIIKGAGNAGGSGAGIVLEYFNFTTDGGNSAPEGVRLTDFQIHGFDIGVQADVANVLAITNPDIDARVYGVKLTTVQDGCTITGGNIVMQSSSAIACIKGSGLGSILTHPGVLIQGVGMNASGTTVCHGVLVNDSGNQNQNNWTVRKCQIANMNVADILFNNAGQGTIEDNDCLSTEPTYSIDVPNVVLGPVYIDKNRCTKDIRYTAAEAASGEVIVGTNTKNGTTLQIGSQSVPTVASAAALTLPLGVKVFLISGTTNITSIVATGWAGRRVTLIFQGVLTLTDGGNLKLGGNFVTTADDAIDLVCDGTSWIQPAPGSAN